MLNLISLEFSGTPLAAEVQSPSFVRQIDWIDQTFPRQVGKVKGSKIYPGEAAESESPSIERRGSGGGADYRHKGYGSTTRPKVQYYCLMSISQSYTDFHIDFGGAFGLCGGLVVGEAPSPLFILKFIIWWR